MPSLLLGERRDTLSSARNRAVSQFVRNYGQAGYRTTIMVGLEAKR